MQRRWNFLGKVYDGSEHEVGDGYPLCKTVATDIESKKVIPLYYEVYSFLAEDAKSENSEILKAIDTIIKHIGDKGIHAIDRGGDRGVIYKKYINMDKPKRFVIRLRERNLIHKGREVDCKWLSKVIPTPYETVLVIYDEGKERRRTIQYNAIPVKLPQYDNKLYFVVVKGLGKEPMMLLTSCPVDIRHKDSVWGIAEYYLARWKCDESYRYIKQSYNLEDIRVRSYISIRNIVVLVLAVSYFAAVYLGESIKLYIAS